MALVGLSMGSLYPVVTFAAYPVEICDNGIDDDANGVTDNEACVAITELVCEGKVATIVGTEGDDVLEGTDGDDVIVGLAGNDFIAGLDGNDAICGGIGNDKILGGNGDDVLRGERGDDELRGNKGNDTLAGVQGNDVLDGGQGQDKLNGGEGSDKLVGGNETPGAPDALPDDCVGGNTGSSTDTFDATCEIIH